jgi:TolB-like protein
MLVGRDQEYMSDGIAEEVLNLLAKIKQLRVISRSSAFSFKGKDIDIPTVAEDLDVSYILEGSVRKAGNQLRITAQLIDARSDTHVWSQTYDRKLENIFEIQDEIAAALDKFLSVPESVESLLGLAIAYHKTGRFDEANAALEQLQNVSREVQAPFWLGALYSEWGELDQAFEWLDKFSYSAWNVAYDPYFRNLHDDPRWKPALAKMPSLVDFGEENDTAN